MEDHSNSRIELPLCGGHFRNQNFGLFSHCLIS